MSVAQGDFQFPLRLGFGCSGALGMSWFPEPRAIDVLHGAYNNGVRHFDTAGFYANGEAERRLGVALYEFRRDVFVSTKTGTRYRRRGGADKDFSPAAIRRDVDNSLARLRRDQLDLVYLHGPDKRGLDEGLETLGRLKAESKIRFAGVCGEGKGLASAIEMEGVDAIMGVYNFLRPDHARVFRRAKDAGISVAAIAPLAQGLYRRDFFRLRSTADVWRIARALVRNRAELARAREAIETLNSFDGWTPAQLALAFVHENPDVDVAITTTTSQGRLAETVGAAGRPPPSEAMRALAALALDASPDGA